MKALVCGTREIVPRLEKCLEARLDNILMRCRKTGETLEVVEGEAKGIDTAAREWAKRNGVKWHPHPAERYGEWPSCGPKRNEAMLKEHPDLDFVLAFHTDWQLGKGTRDMVQKARAKGLPVEIHLR